MHPFPTSIHSSTDSPSLLIVRDFSMSRAGRHISRLCRRDYWWQLDGYLQSPNSRQASVSSADGWRRSLGLAILTIHDDGNLLAVLGGQDVVQESRLACAEISCKPLPSESDPARNTSHEHTCNYGDGHLRDRLLLGLQSRPRADQVRWRVIVPVHSGNLSVFLKWCFLCPSQNTRTADVGGFEVWQPL